MYTVLTILGRIRETTAYHPLPVLPVAIHPETR